MPDVLGLLLQIVIMIVLAPLPNGIIKKVKALTQKRIGNPLLQPYYNILKLFSKDMVIADRASWIFKIMPYILLGSTIIAAAFVPVSTLINLPAFSGDIILVIYVLALGRFFQALAALDTGTTFGGMGSSREMMISSLIEPALLVVVFTLGLIAQTTSITGIIEYSGTQGMAIFQPVYLLAFLALVIILLTEAARIPVDDPATDLELTMVHEAMLLEYSGKYLGLIELASAIKQLIFITLVVNIFMPVNLFSGREGLVVILASVLFYIVKVIILSVIIALIEVNTVKLRMFSIPNLAALSFICAFMGFLQFFVLGGH